MVAATSPGCYATVARPGSSFGPVPPSGALRSSDVSLYPGPGYLRKVGPARGCGRGMAFSVFLRGRVLPQIGKKGWRETGEL
jgi:hypothetical protein